MGHPRLLAIRMLILIDGLIGVIVVSGIRFVRHSRGSNVGKSRSHVTIR